MIIYDLLLFNFSLATVPAIIIAAASANSSSTSFSATYIFGVISFHFRRIWYEKPAPENGSRFVALVSGACVMVITSAAIVVVIGVRANFF